MHNRLGPGSGREDFSTRPRRIQRPYIGVGGKIISVDRGTSFNFNQISPAIIADGQTVDVRFTGRIRRHIRDSAIKIDLHQTCATTGERGVVIGSVQHP